MKVNKNFFIFIYYFLAISTHSNAAVNTLTNQINKNNLTQNNQLESCLSKISSYTHRIDKENTLRSCFQKLKNDISRDLCFGSLKKIKISSSALTEEINSVCFYETTMAKNFSGCMIETKKFKSSYNHDDAIFFCVQYFQETVSTKECLSAANEMIFPLKKEYLTQQCKSDIF